MRPDLLARIQATNKPFKIFTDYVEDGAMEQFAECMEQPSVIQGALMPDTHSGYVAPIGSVLLVKNNIFPSFVGYDIGCGMSECMLDIQADSITKEQYIAIKNQILRDIPIGFNRHKTKQCVPIKCDMTSMALEILADHGTLQLGTLGGGNHFIELGESEQTGNLSIIIHSGSRGVGHKIATHYMKEAAIANTDERRYKREFDEKNIGWYKATLAKGATKTLNEKYHVARKEFVYRRVRARVDNIEDAYPLDINTQLGKDYINDMNMCLEFALANRKQMIDKCAYAVHRVLGLDGHKEIKELRFINRNHNHAELTTVPMTDESYKNYQQKCFENNDTCLPQCELREEGWIHRKGATQAQTDMLGVIPGNMVDGSFVVKGKGNNDSLSSSSHGAGRVLSRKKAKESLSLDDFKQQTSHLVANHSDSNLDEAPDAYKNIFEVMDNQRNLVEVIDRIVPIINIKG